jgi:hypothetical protein
VKIKLESALSGRGPTYPKGGPQLNYWKRTDLRRSQWFIVNDSGIATLHHVDVGRAVNVSELNAAFIFRVEVSSRMIDSVILKVEVTSASEMHATRPTR